MRNDNMPTVVWVYETVTMELKAVLGEPTVAAMGSLCRLPPHAVLCRRVCLVDPTVHLNAVRAFKWGPRGTRLAIVTGNSKVRGAAAATAMGLGRGCSTATCAQIYFWEESGATCLVVKGARNRNRNRNSNSHRGSVRIGMGGTSHAVHLAEGFTALRLKWCPSGEKLVVLSRTSWTCGYLER